MIVVEILSKEDCHLCEEAKAVLERVRREIPFNLKETMLTPSDEQYQEFHDLIPVVRINNAVVFKHRVDEKLLRRKLKDAPRS